MSTFSAVAGAIISTGSLPAFTNPTASRLAPRLKHTDRQHEGRLADGFAAAYASRESGAFRKWLHCEIEAQRMHDLEQRIVAGSPFT